MGEDDFDWGSLFGGGNTDMSNFDLGGLDLNELALADLGNFDVSDLDLGNMDFGNLDLGNFNLSDLNLSDLNLGDLNLGNQTQELDINSILEGLKTDRTGGQNLDLASLLQDIGTTKNDFGNPFTEEQMANLSGHNMGAYLPGGNTPTQEQELNIAPEDYAQLTDELAALMGSDSTKAENLGLGNLAENAGGAYDQDYSNINALEALMGKNLSSPGEEDISNLGMGDLATNVGGVADQSYNPEAILKSIRSGNEAVASGMSPGSVGAEQAVGGENENLTGNQLAEAYGTSGKGSVYQNDNTLSSGVSKNEAIASGNAPGTEGAKALVSGELNSDQIAALLGQTPAGKSVNEAIASGNAPGSEGAKALVNGKLTDNQIAALTGQNNGLASLLPSTSKSKNEAIASGTRPGSEGAKMLAEAASNSSLDNAFTPAEEAALVGKTPTSTSTGISKNEAIASGMSPGSAGAKAAAAGELSPEELAAAQGVVTKGSVYNPVTAAEKTADVLKKIADTKATPAAKDGSNNMGMMMMLMALMAMMNKGGGGGGSSGATIPSLSADRKQLPYGGGASNYRPGQGGVNYFTPTTYTTKAAGGGLMSLNGGGHLGGYSDGGHLLRGPGDGVSDSIPATIGGKQPARLATGEFVVPARIVSELGNGSTDAGAQRLYEMMDRVQRARRKTKNVAADTKAAKYLPA